MLSSISLRPYAVCWMADQSLIWVMVVTNSITFVSYLSICLTLPYLYPPHPPLRVVKQIVLRHGGDIRVETATEKGTSFTLWWPRRFLAPQK